MQGHEVLGTLMMIGIVFGVVLIIAWIVLPFAIIGTKPLLSEILAELRSLNEALRRK